jgi:hypothetical protein
MTFKLAVQRQINFPLILDDEFYKWVTRKPTNKSLINRMMYHIHASEIQAYVDILINTGFG